MKFGKGTFTHKETGALVDIYLPMTKRDARMAGDRRNVPMVPCDIDGRMRYLSSHVLSYMQWFNQDVARRTTLGHDCAVFALACMTGNSYETHVQRSGMSEIDIRAWNLPKGGTCLYEPDVKVGEVVVTTDVDPLDIMFEERDFRPHFMVKVANEDEVGPSPYASKFGPVGPVALHTFTAPYEFYPSVAAGIVEAIRP